MTARAWVERNVIDKVPALHKPYAWSTVRREINRETFEVFWAESESLPIGVPGFLGLVSSRLSNFYKVKIDWEFEHAENYYCVLDNCHVMWYDGHVLMSAGPAGCPCDQLKDPRGEQIEDD